jgi:antitoxin VapB
VTTVTSRISQSADGEEIRLPDEIAFGRELEVTIVRTGDVLTIYPKQKPVAVMIAKLRELPGPDDIEVRDADVVPDRPGL